MLTAVCAATGRPRADHAGVEHGGGQPVPGAVLAALAPGVHAVLLWDGAGYHTGGDLVVPANVSLIRLPPYSPELNPVENLWHYLRSHHWSNRVYDGLRGPARRGDGAWWTVCLDPEKIRSDPTRPLSQRCR